LIGYHFWCHVLMTALREGRNTRSQRWLRMFNEVPALLLIAIVILAVVKPF
jgi:putative membrane protein